MVPKRPTQGAEANKREISRVEPLHPRIDDPASSFSSFVEKARLDRVREDHDNLEGLFQNPMGDKVEKRRSNEKSPDCDSVQISWSGDGCRKTRLLVEFAKHICVADVIAHPCNGQLSTPCTKLAPLINPFGWWQSKTISSMYTTTSYIRIKCHTRNCLMCLQDKLEEIKMAFDADGTIGDVFGMVFDCHHSSDLVEGAGLVQSVDNGPSLQGGDLAQRSPGARRGSGGAGLRHTKTPQIKFLCGNVTQSSKSESAGTDPTGSHPLAG
ncbi:hypothetical protein PSTG_15250 [Puccinia striiformis f. sp. tritici PST-78]|uniref:Uncharacterized protein n=1 Tax=Puccinia striiformis f. sp. tritici PST-78 TaxID=1165861 RepID=A0A0L0UWC3_9BASI|nr:hypothetical protein PSTG_15250 [Puccinia striiformis f. sp. tritici PST-78]